MFYEFKEYDCIIIDECESVFEDLLSGLCRNANFELGMQVLERLLKTSKKVLMLDAFLKNSTLSVACEFATSTDDVRIVIASYKIQRGTL